MSAVLLGQVLQSMAPILHCKNKADITDWVALLPPIIWALLNWSFKFLLLEFNLIANCDKISISFKSHRADLFQRWQQFQFKYDSGFWKFRPGFRPRQCTGNVWNPNVKAKSKNTQGWPPPGNNHRVSWAGSAHRLSTELATGYSAPHRGPGHGTTLWGMLGETRAKQQPWCQHSVSPPTTSQVPHHTTTRDFITPIEECLTIILVKS